MLALPDQWDPVGVKDYAELPFPIEYIDYQQISKYVWCESWDDNFPAAGKAATHLQLSLTAHSMYE